MFWVYNLLFFFLMKQNFHLYNFYSINLNNFFNLNFKKQSINLFTNKNTNYKLNLLRKNNFLLKYVNYFNKLILFQNNIINKNQVIYNITINKFNYFYFNHYNYFFFKKLLNLIFDLSFKNYNFLVLDKSYKNITPLYNYIFNLKNLLSFKGYFFLKPSFFTYNNWQFYYIKFLNNFNVSLLVILDFSYFNKFFKTLKNVNLPISSLIPIDNASDFIDYPIYVNYAYSFEKFVFYNIITQITLVSYNFKTYKLKLNFLKLFYNFSLKTKF